VFTFYGNELGVEMARCAKFSKVFDHVSLRSNRVSGHDIDVTQTDGVGSCY
jgi:hypothetical protein